MTNDTQANYLYLNQGNGNFKDAGPLSGAALGDYDNDGDLDVLLMDLDAQPILIENRSPQKNWLRIKAPIGTRVIIEARKLQWMDEMRASGSYQSASESIVHFGLGDVQQVDRVTARFTNGKTKTLVITKANQTITIKG